MQKPQPSPVQTAADEMTAGGGGGGEKTANLPGGAVALREVESAPTEAGTRGSRTAFAAVQGRPGSECAGGRREREDIIDVDAEPPPPPRVGNRLLYPLSSDRGTPDGCGRAGLWKEEDSRTGRACWCGCPSSSFPPSRRWVGGLGSAYDAVSGMRGCVTCVHACLGPHRACWSGA